MAKRWYVIHTYSGYENKVKTDLEHRIEMMGMQDQIVDIQIPTEEVTEIKDGGKRETKESKVLPSYVLVRMEGNDDTWSFVRNTPGVTGFVGPDGKPSPLRRSEFDKIMRRTGARGTTPATPKRTSTNVEVGQSAVRQGPLRPSRGLRRHRLRGQRRVRQAQGHAPHLWPRDLRGAWARPGFRHRIKGDSAGPNR